MQNPKKLIRFEDLRGRPIVARVESERLGKIEDVLFSPDDGRITAILVDTDGLIGRLGELLGQEQAAVRARDIDAIGPDAILVRDKHSVMSVKKLRTRDLISVRSLKDKSVITEAGKKLHGVSDVLLDQDRLILESYLVMPTDVRGLVPAAEKPEQEIVVPVGPEVTIGEEIITIPVKNSKGNHHPSLDGRPFDDE